MWRVILIKSSPNLDYAPGYFPRLVRYKADAEKIVERVRKLGGDAKIVR